MMLSSLYRPLMLLDLNPSFFNQQIYIIIEFFLLCYPIKKHLSIINIIKSNITKLQVPKYTDGSEQIVLGFKFFKL